MTAPSGTIWGDIVGSYGRIGIYVSLSGNNVAQNASVQVWFWSKFSVSDSNNLLTVKYGKSNSTATTTATSGSKNINTTIASGDGWSTSNQVLIETFTVAHARSKTAEVWTVYANLANVDRVGGTMYARANYTVPALPNYTITYNANGGSGAPSKQTKYYEEAITLSSATPTRSGYNFAGWATSASGSVAYAAGAKYTANASITLYAKWTAHTYQVSYNANGGSGAPSSQTKTHGVALTLSSTKPTRTNYTFLGWSISASATTATYAAGGSYTENTAVTLYAVWGSNYKIPAIFNLRANRCNSDGTLDDEGENGLIQFDWQCTNNVTAISIAWSSTSASGSATVSASGKNGSVSQVIGNNTLSVEASFDITVTVNDGGTSSAKTTLPGSLFPIDALAGGGGVSFGKPAELEGVADFAFDAKFNKPVYGKALGMDRLPAIPQNADFNNYMETGCYAVQSNAIAATITNIPVARAGRLEVWSSTGEGLRLQQWSYLRQRFIPYNAENSVWERDISRGEDNVWHYYDWYRSSLTPSMSSRIYEKAGITAGLSTNVTDLADDAYTKVPFDKEIVNINSDKLDLYGNSGDNYVLVGDGVSRVKVSGQILFSCKSTGNRHVRIQKVLASTGGVSNVSWVCVNAGITGNLLCSLSPMIVNVSKGDKIQMVYYTTDGGTDRDHIAAGSSGNGYQSYLTVEEF